MQEIIAIFQDYTFQVVATGTALLGMMSGITGSFAVLQKESLLGDALSHAALPGLVLGFLLTGRKDWAILLVGATLSGLLATALIRWMSVKTVKFDSALSLSLSSFFGLGLVLLTVAQKTNNANQAGLENYIYGQAAGMLASNVTIILIFSVLAILLMALLWKEFKVYTFDPVFSKTIGFNHQLLQFLLSLLLIVTVILGLESVGVILMSALIIMPAVSSRQWVKHLFPMILLSGIFGLVSGVIGTLISSLDQRIPTGPSIVVIAGIITIFSICFAPHRGVIAKNWRRYKQRQALKKGVR